MYLRTRFEERDIRTCLANKMSALGLLLTLLLGELSVRVAESAPSRDRFGGTGPRHEIEAMDGFPDTKTFFDYYVSQHKPLKMTGAGKLSPAYERWSDEYFLKLKIPLDDSVLVETKKKENRLQPSVNMHFKDFVRLYNKTDQYMVQNIPQYLGKDVVLPKPLQCPEISADNLVEAIAWFSSGGTKSVVHTDSVDNIICVYRGVKEFVMVDPNLYGDVVVLDRPEGAYADIDVDSVDYEKYPGLAKAEYYHVNLTAGDCMYIPYKWIHQVRSHERNLAVNIWWDAHRNKQVNTDACPDAYDDNWTLDKANFAGFGRIMLSPDNIRDQFRDFVRGKNGQLTIEEFENILVSDLHLEDLDVGQGYKIPITEMFRILDADKNGQIIVNEVLAASDEDLLKVATHLEAVEDIAAAIEQKMAEHEGEPYDLEEDENDGDGERDEL